MKRLLAILLACPLIALVGSLGYGQILTVPNTGGLTVDPRAPLTEATARALLGPGMLGAADNVGAANWGVRRTTANSAGTTMTPANPTRRSVLCENYSSEDVYIGPNPGVNASTGKKITAAAGVTLRSTGAIYWYSASGTASICSTENYD